MQPLCEPSLTKEPSPEPRRTAILSTVDAVPDWSGKCSTGGRVNAAKALANILGKTVTVPCESSKSAAAGAVVLAASRSCAVHAAWALPLPCKDSCHCLAAHLPSPHASWCANASCRMRCALARKPPSDRVVDAWL